MKFICTCMKGIPVISTIHPRGMNVFAASHCCSQCGAHLSDVELKVGDQIIATDNNVSGDGKYTIPKGRLVRITAFSDMSSCTGFLFAGLLAAGIFRPEGFAATWNIAKILDI